MSSTGEREIIRWESEVRFRLSSCVKVLTVGFGHVRDSRRWRYAWQLAVAGG